MTAPSPHKSRAKDIGSPAVMLSLVNAAVVRGLTLWPLIRG